jgi:predicted permease
VDVIQDVRYAARLTRKSPGFSLCVVMLLALGIGLNSAIFTLLNALLLRPLPVEKPAELVRLVQVSPNLGPRSYFTYNAYRALVRNARSFTSVFGYAELNVAVREASEAHLVRCQIVTGSFFTALGVRPLYGRVFTPDDELHASGSLPVVISYSYWMRHFGGDPLVVNRRLTLQNRPFVIVGVMPESFNGVQLETSPEIRVPLIASNLLLNDPEVDSYTKLGYTLVARLRPGVNLERARAEAEAIVWAAIEEQHNAETYWHEGRFELQPIPNGVSLVRPKFSSALVLLMGGSALLLLIVCANIGGLLLARTAARRGEIAVRLAVGATSARLVRQWLTETLLLATFGGLAGLGVAFSATPLVALALPPLRDPDATALTLSLNLKPDARAFAFSFSLCLISALLAGLPAALQTARTDLHSTLKAGRATPRQSLRWMLVLFQLALCTLLLSAAGLLIFTFRQLRALDPGFDRDHVVTFSLDPGMLNYTSQQAGSLQSRLLATVRELPGVESAGIASRGVMRGTGMKVTVAPAGKRVPHSEFMNTSTNAVSPEYFEAMGMRFLSGRNFRADEPKTNPAPAVVNRAFVRHFFLKSDAIGEKFGFGVAVGKPASADYQIIGVVSDAKYRSLREVIPPTMYGLWLGEAQRAAPFILHVRTRHRPETIIRPVENALRAIDPRLPFYEIRTLAEEVDASLWAERVLAWLSTAFAIVAAVLAAIGVDATLTYAIAQGKREIGIRMALGALPADVARLLSMRPMMVATLGVAAGTAGFYAVSPLFRNVLFGVSPTNPFAPILGVALVLLIALVTTLVAVSSAIRVSPPSVLREE